MGSLMQDLKRQASFFLSEKINTARLVLTDVTPIQILAEEITNAETLAPPDAHAMKLISKAAFEVDDYERIVHILHGRLSKFDTQNWRATYKALILLEHLLTHGPLRVAEEFESHQETIQDISSFQFHDDKGFDWGSSVKKKAKRVNKLIEDRSYLKEERASASKLTFGIKGFGSANYRPPSSVNDRSIKDFFRSKTHHNFTSDYEYKKKLLLHPYYCTERGTGLDHPFWDHDKNTKVSLLSSVRSHIRGRWRKE